MSGRITVLVHKSHGPDHVKHVVVVYKVRLKGCPEARRCKHLSSLVTSRGLHRAAWLGA